MRLNLNNLYERLTNETEKRIIEGTSTMKPVGIIPSHQVERGVRMDKNEPKTEKPANRPPSQFKKSQAVGLQVVIKLTEIEPVKKFIGEIEWARDKVEECDVSKETAYMMIIRAYDVMKDEVREQAGESDDREEEEL